MTLRRQTTSAALWQILARGADRGLRFVASLVLARMLAPADFGLLAATMVVAGVVETLSYLGIDHAVVQSKREDARFLGSALRVMLLRGGLLAAVTAALAPVAAWYFEDGAMTAMVLLIAASPLASGCENPSMYIERKHLRFKPLAVASVAGAVAQVAVSVGGAAAGLGAKALALGFVASAVATAAAGWILVPRRVDFTADPEASAELGAFARRAAGVPFLIMLSSSAPSIVLGRISGLDVLGIYSLAQRLCSLPTEIALPIFGAVLTPAYAGIKDDLDRVRRIWLKTLTGVALLVMPIVAGLVVLDERLPRILYGDQYTGAPGLVSMIAVVGLVSSLSSCCGPMFWGLGRPQLDRWSIAIRLVVIVGLAPVAAWKGGATAFAGAIAIAHLAGLAYCLVVARRIVSARRREVLRALVPGAALGGATLALCTIARSGVEALAVGDALVVAAVLAVSGAAALASGLAIKRGAVA